MPSALNLLLECQPGSSRCKCSVHVVHVIGKCFSQRWKMMMHLCNLPHSFTERCHIISSLLSMLFPFHSKWRGLCARLHGLRERLKTLSENNLLCYLMHPMMLFSHFSWNITQCWQFFLYSPGRISAFKWYINVRGKCGSERVFILLKVYCVGIPRCSVAGNSTCCSSTPLYKSHFPFFFNMT